MAEPTIDVASEGNDGFLIGVINEIIYSPLNLGLLLVIVFLIYKIIKGRIEVPHSHQKFEEPPLPKLRRDFTVKELRIFDGTQEDGRVLVGVNGSVYDVTKGKKFYGPGGPYASFAGRDASRNLATFSVNANDKEEYDDLSDLNTMEMESVCEWELQFKEKYDYVGRLLRPGEVATNYSDEEEDTVNDKIDDLESESIAEGNEIRQRPIATPTTNKTLSDTETK